MGEKRTAFSSIELCAPLYRISYVESFGSLFRDSLVGATPLFFFSAEPYESLLFENATSSALGIRREKLRRYRFALPPTVSALLEGGEPFPAKS